MNNIKSILTSAVVSIITAISFTSCTNTCTSNSTSAVDNTPAVATTSTTEVEHVRYVSSDCRYYTDGYVIDSCGERWDYTTDVISDRTPYNNMPVYMCIDNNGTSDIIEDDIVLGLVYDMNTAIYDTLEINLKDADFNISRDGNNITINQ